MTATILTGCSWMTNLLLRARAAATLARSWPRAAKSTRWAAAISMRRGSPPRPIYACPRWCRGSGVSHTTDWPPTDEQPCLQVPFPVGVKVVDVACGELHAIALSAEGVCFAWGRNTKGAILNLHFHIIDELTHSLLCHCTLDCINHRPMRARYVDTVAATTDQTRPSCARE